MNFSLVMVGGKGKAQKVYHSWLIATQLRLLKTVKELKKITALINKYLIDNQWSIIQYLNR